MHVAQEYVAVWDNDTHAVKKVHKCHAGRCKSARALPLTSG